MKTNRTSLTLLLGLLLAATIGLPATEPAPPAAPKPTVTALGAVLHPGRYVWSPGLTIEVLLQKAGGLTPDARRTARVIRSTARSTRDNLAVDLAKEPNFELVGNDLVHFERVDQESTPKNSASEKLKDP